MPMFTPKMLEEVNQKIASLEARRERIVAALRLESERLATQVETLKTQSDEIEKFLKSENQEITEHLAGDRRKLYKFIVNNPGASRSEIDKEMSNLEKNRVSYILTCLRRDFELIENRGTPGPDGSRWFAL